MTYLMRLNQINFGIITPEKDEPSGLNTYSARHLCLLMCSTRNATPHSAMRDKNALKLPWDRTLKGIFLQLAFVVVLNVFYLNFEKANREID